MYISIRVYNKTYYVVAQMGQNNLSSYLLALASNKNYSATDYMLETVSFVYCLLFINTFYLYKLDASSNSILLNSENNDTTISLSLVTLCKQATQLMDTQSAENCKGFSETARQLPDTEDYKFWNWFAGIIDGDGNFNIRIDPLSKKKVLKQIRIKLHKDIRILSRIQDFFFYI